MSILSSPTASEPLALSAIATEAPGGKLSVALKVDDRKFDYNETLIHMLIMAAPPSGYTPEKEIQYHDDYTINVYVDGELAGAKTHFFREHDGCMQILEDIWYRLQIVPGEHIITFENTNTEGYLLFNRIIFQPCSYDHLQLSLPAWALVGEKIIGKVFAVKNDYLSSISS